jgi:hypothetical protein
MIVIRVMFISLLSRSGAVSLFTTTATFACEYRSPLDRKLQLRAFMGKGASLKKFGIETFNPKVPK